MGVAAYAYMHVLITKSACLWVSEDLCIYVCVCVCARTFVYACTCVDVRTCMDRKGDAHPSNTQRKNLLYSWHSKSIQ